MTRLTFLALFLTPALPATAEFRPKTEPELTYKQDGDTLIVSTTVTINGSDHVLLTSVDRTEQNPPRLRYTIFQNSDVLVRGEKKVTIEWRLKGYKDGDKSFKVVGQVVMLNTEELKELGGKAAVLAKGLYWW